MKIYQNESSINNFICKFYSYKVLYKYDDVFKFLPTKDNISIEK